MSEWHRQIQTTVNHIDDAIRQGLDETLTLEYLAERIGYSPSQTSRTFHALTGVSLRQYLQGRKLAFALIEVRDTNDTLLEIAVRYGFSSHEAFTRAFKRLYGLAPKTYRSQPVPVVLRTKINPLDRYLIGQGVRLPMKKTNANIKIYPALVPAHKFLHIKNYDSNGYFDFWQKQESIPGQDCDTICGLLDSIKGKLDGDDSEIGQYSGQIMGFPQEPNGRTPEAYGIRMPADYSGEAPAGMLSLDIAEGEYMVFEYGPFNFETECEALYKQLDTAMKEYRWEDGAYCPDETPGRIAYYYNDPTRYLKRVVPVKKR